LWATALSLVLRVALNFALIPSLGFIGPSLAFLGGEIAILSLMMTRLRSIGYPLAIFDIIWAALGRERRDGAYTFCDARKFAHLVFALGGRRMCCVRRPNS
jgi:hypothetical protein